MKTLLVPAVRAFIRYNDKILILRESKEYKGGANIGRYDTPGGKIKPGEHFKDTIAREVLEEAGLTVEIGKPFYTDEWRPIVKDTQFHIVGIFFECFCNSDKVTLSKDHDDYQWIDPKDYMKFELIDEIKSAFEEYLSVKGQW